MQAGEARPSGVSIQDGQIMRLGHALSCRVFRGPKGPWRLRREEARCYPVMVEVPNGCRWTYFHGSIAKDKAEEPSLSLGHAGRNRKVSHDRIWPSGCR